MSNTDHIDNANRLVVCAKVSQALDILEQWWEENPPPEKWTPEDKGLRACLSDTPHHDEAFRAMKRSIKLVSACARGDAGWSQDQADQTLQYILEVLLRLPLTDRKPLTPSEAGRALNKKKNNYSNLEKSMLLNYYLDNRDQHKKPNGRYNLSAIKRNAHATGNFAMTEETLSRWLSVIDKKHRL